ncbi:hypothetical protein LJR267_009947 [Paraburkholderia hospita]|jgi:hypothetical protein
MSNQTCAPYRGYNIDVEVEVFQIVLAGATHAYETGGRVGGTWR